MVCSPKGQSLFIFCLAFSRLAVSFFTVGEALVRLGPPTVKGQAHRARQHAFFEYFGAKGSPTEQRARQLTKGLANCEKLASCDKS